MNEQYVRNVIEAGLLAAGRSLTLDELAQLFGEAERPVPSAVRAALDALEADYAGRAIELRETASGLRIQVRRDFATEVSRLWPERPQKYSRALLETLALIAYRQPITRAEIEGVRGVAVNPNIVRTLLERNWVRVVGHRELPGHPELIGTTREFLDYFGLRSLDELPPLAELRSLEDTEPQLPLPVSLASHEGDAMSASAGLAPEPTDQPAPAGADGPAANEPDVAGSDASGADTAGPEVAGPDAAG